MQQFSERTDRVRRADRGLRPEGPITSRAGNRLYRSDVSSETHSKNRPLSFPLETLRRMHPIDIILPVYGNFHDARKAIDSVLENKSKNKTDFRLIVIDDASPDAFADFIGDTAKHANIILVRNETNLGFVLTVNSGFAMSQTNDVIILNSDTEVYGDWIDRLGSMLSSDRTIGTITPLSNAATILSYPREGVDYSGALEISWREVDEMCATLGSPPLPIPTGIGFCMAIRRSCLDMIGDFDAGHFGRGYGEENDFCMRAHARGWKNVAARNVFVWHRGGGSFKGDKQKLSNRAQQVLKKLHPEYSTLVETFRRQDPLAPLRAELDIRRVLHSTDGRLVVGSDKSEAPSGRKSVHLFPGSRRNWEFRFDTGEPLSNIPGINSRDSVDDIASLLNRLNISTILISRHFRVPRNILVAAESIGATIVRRGLLARAYKWFGAPT